MNLPAARRFDGWLLAPAPPERLALFRILVGAFACAYLTVRLPAFVALGDNEPSRFEPVGVLWLLDSPIPSWLWRTILFATLAFGLAFTAGFRFRISGPFFAMLLLAVTTYRSSWGQVLHFENLLVLQALIVGFSPSADAMAAGGRGRASAQEKDHVDVRYGWPLRLAAMVAATTYVLAGVAKLRYGGTAWLFGDALRHHIAYSAVRLDLLGGDPSPLARPLVRRDWLVRPAAIVTVTLELGAPVALFGRRLRNAWVASIWLLHAGIAATMFVVFPYPLALIAFAPMFELERIRRVRRNPGPAAASTAPPATSARRW